MSTTIAGVRITVTPGFCLMLAFCAAAVSFFWGLGAGLLTIAVLAVINVSHELGHIAAAALFRIPAQKVTFLSWGACVTYNGGAERPLVLGVVSAAGPAMNGIIGLGAILLLPVFGPPVAWLGIASLAYCIINIAPFYPRDGGRIAYAYLWNITKSEEKAQWLSRFVTVLFTISLTAAFVVNSWYGAAVVMLVIGGECVMHWR